MGQEHSIPTYPAPQHLQQATDSVQRHLQQTDPVLDQRLERLRQASQTQTPGQLYHTRHSSELLNPNQAPPQTVDPAYLKLLQTDEKPVQSMQLAGSHQAPGEQTASTTDQENWSMMMPANMPGSQVFRQQNRELQQHSQQPNHVDIAAPYQQPGRSEWSWGEQQIQLSQNPQLPSSPGQYGQRQSVLLRGQAPEQQLQITMQLPIQPLVPWDIQFQPAQNPLFIQPLQGSQQRAIPLHPDLMHTLVVSYAGADLNSKKQTLQPKFEFPIPGFPDPPGHTLRPQGVPKRTRNGEGSNDLGEYDPPFPGPITLLHTPDAAQFCRVMKAFLMSIFGNTLYGAEGIVRMETQEWHKLEAKSEGYVLLAEDACRTSFPFGGGGGRNAIVFAVLVPTKAGRVKKRLGDKGWKFAWEKDARFFWCVAPIGPLLGMLNGKGVTVLDEFQPGTAKHKQFTTWLRQSFLQAVNIPDSLDYKNAMVETDCCPSIIDPDNALKRLENNEFLYYAAKNAAEYGRDLSDDRYLLHLHAAEREAASLANVRCAEYLLIKRVFFKAFYEEIYRSDKKIDPHASNTVRGRGVPHPAPQPLQRTQDKGRDAGTPDREDTPMSGSNATPAAVTPAVPASRPRTPGTNRSAIARRVRVRTETAHQRWLENTYAMRSRPAKCLVTCWKELGFLDEGRFLGWVRAGGMFADGEAQDEDGDEE